MNAPLHSERSRGLGQSFLIGEGDLTTILSAPLDRSLSVNLRLIFSAQARLLAGRAERGLPIGSGSLQRLVQLGERLARMEERAA